MMTLDDIPQLEMVAWLSEQHVLPLKPQCKGLNQAGGFGLPTNML